MNLYMMFEANWIFFIKIRVQILGFDYYNPSYLLANLRSYEKRFETLPCTTWAICEINLREQFLRATGDISLLIKRKDWNDFIICYNWL